MRLLKTLILGLIFFGFLFGFSSSLGFLFFDRPGAAIGSGLVGLFLFYNTLRWKSLWTRELKGRRVQTIRSLEIFYVNDPSSHVFLVAHPWRAGGAIYLTRGILSLLNAAELDTLVQDSERVLNKFGMGWNTFISSLQLRVIKFLSPDSLRFFYAPRAKEIGTTPWATLRALPSLGLLDILRRFLLPQEALKSDVLKKVLAESYACAPRVSAVASAHSLVDPWPQALLRTSQPCAPREA